ncbi:alpha/beta hydrolase fold protein [Alcanivorax sp. 521-1]|uniref:Alpha/beta hydrolase fold protein n=1 Tax=Alloalcanivorax profundimaris TaxID=2735259 RepID=A0ABS0ART2_9GAMM|nr:alpha/beta fold hydrolase [Alloalcanivorax profundimaris]MBF5056855.1 alpha/beta hydrolase fold protein [Alloalcanivorax profundimaris]
MKQDRQTVRLRQGTLSYLHAGRGAPVVFFHGLNGNAESWRRQLDGLAGELSMWAWDAPGYGASDAGGEHLDDLADAAIEFIERVAPGPVSLVGHSMGGLVALRVALRDPARVDRLVLSCTHAGHGLNGADAADQRYRRRLGELRELPPSEYGARRARGMLPESAGAAVFDEVARIAAASRPEGMGRAALAIQRANLQPELGRVKAPTLVITADHDRVAPLAKAQPLLDGIPDARHRVLEGLGHAPYIEDSGRYNTLLRDFLTARRQA